MKIKRKRPSLEAPEVYPTKHSNGRLTLRDALERVDSCRQTGENQWEAICPAHADQRPSLHLSEGTNGKLLMHCKAGCRFEDILKELESCEPLRTTKPEGSPAPVSDQGDSASVTPASPVSPPASISAQTESEAMTDLFDCIAKQLINYYSSAGGRLIFVLDDGFYRYRKDETGFREGGFYEPVHKDFLLAQIRDAARQWARSHNKEIRVDGALLNNSRQALQSELLVREGEITLNSEPSSLNLRNGIYCLKSKRLTTHDPNFFSTIQFPVKYDPNAKCPLWLKTLDQIFMNDPVEVRRAKIKLLRQCLGLCLTTDNSYHKILVLLGSGRNGKDTILHQLEHILTTKNYAALSMEQLGNKFNLSMLKDKLVNITTEIGSKTVLPDDIIKMLTGQSPITAERKFKDPFTFTNNAKLIFATNDMPTTTDRSYALEARLLVIEMTRRFSETEKIVGLKEQIASQELNGIFLWMLRGLEELQEQGRFIVPKEIQKATDTFMRENNTVLAFEEEWLVMNTKGRLPKARVYKAYCRWCEDNRQKPFSQNRFSRIFTECFPELRECKVESDLRGWEGVAFNNAVPSYLRITKKKLVLKNGKLAWRKSL